MARDHRGGVSFGRLIPNKEIRPMRERALQHGPELLNVQKIVNVDPRLSQNRPESSLRHFARMVGNRCIAVSFFVIPDFVALCGLPIKSEPEGPEPSRDVSISESGKPSHLQEFTMRG